MIDLTSARDHIASSLSEAAQLVLLGGRQAVTFRAFGTDATLMVTKPEAEALAGVVVFAEVRDPRLNLPGVNAMNQRINFGSVRYYDPDVAIIASGALFAPDEPVGNLDKLLTAWSDTIEQFRTYLADTPN